MHASVFVGASLDGFIARPNHDLDWLPGVESEDFGYKAFVATVDALVIGRKTYEKVLEFDSWPYEQRAVFVLSTRPLAPPPEGVAVERMSGTPTEILAQLSARGYRHTYVDGGVTIQGFLRAGLIQRIVITRLPVLIGEGIPLFGATGRDIALKHVATRSFPSGAVQTEYEVSP